MASCMCTGACRNGGKCPNQDVFIPFCVTPTITTGSTTTVTTFPDYTKRSKKQRIAELEARVATLEAELARRPIITYTNDRPWWRINPYPPTYVTTSSAY